MLHWWEGTILLAILEDLSIACTLGAVLDYKMAFLKDSLHLFLPLIPKVTLNLLTYRPQSKISNYTENYVIHHKLNLSFRLFQKNKFQFMCFGENTKNKEKLCFNGNFSNKFL